MFSRVMSSQLSLGLGSIYMQTQRNVSSTGDKAHDHFDEVSKETEDKIMKLIFGIRTYQDFTSEEKKLVDWYQDLVQREDGCVVLPNTRIDWEHQKAMKLFKKKEE